jgi:putative peptide zinc metalloprotease protein
MKPWQRLAARTVAILTWRHAWRQADAVVARIYRGCGNVLLQPVSLAMFFLIGLAGLAVFAWQLLHGWYGAAAAAPLGPSQVVTLVLLVWGSGCLHELGHAIAVKHFGREVISIGYGWYWLGPCFFVDTSDMWIAPRNARIAVSLAGPCVDFLFAGLAAISCFLLPPSCAPYAFVFSVDRYIAMGFNLCPLMEGDGYCILMDVSGKENLRSRAFDLLINRLPCSAWKLSFLKQNRTELLYSAGSIFYLVAMGALSISAWRNVVAHWLERAMSPWAAAALGWTLAALLGSSLAMGLIGELHQHFKRTAEAA